MQRFRVVLNVGVCCSLLLLGCRENRLPNSAVVRGTVLDGDRPIAKAEVSFISKSGPKATGVTGSDGTFELLLPSGQKGAMIGGNEVIIVTGLPEPVVPANGQGEVALRSSTELSFRYSFPEPVIIQASENQITLNVKTARKLSN